MLTYSYLQGVEPPPRRPRDRCGETPSPLEKANAQLKRKRRRITNSAGVPAGTCICCTQDTTNFALIFRVPDVTGIFRRAPGGSRPRTARRSDGRTNLHEGRRAPLAFARSSTYRWSRQARWTGSSQNEKVPVQFESESRGRREGELPIYLRLVTCQPGPHRVAVRVERRRRHVPVAGDLLPSAVEEAQRRPRQLERAEGVVVDGDLQALAGYLVPAVHLVDRANLPGRDPHLGEMSEQVRCRPVRERLLDQGDRLFAVGHPFGVGSETRRGRVDVERLAQP